MSKINVKIAMRSYVVVVFFYLDIELEVGSELQFECEWNETASADIELHVDGVDNPRVADIVSCYKCRRC